jgi:hypothetical protein
VENGSKGTTAGCTNKENRGFRSVRHWVLAASM